MEDSEEKGPISKLDDSPSSQGRTCALCGCSTPAVRCDRCNSQTFCLSCDDMYHRHPKRRLHLRKAVDSIWSSSQSPRLRRCTDLPGDPSKIPIPPPRTKKRERHIICGKPFLKPGYELGSFGHSNRIFDMKNSVVNDVPKPDLFPRQKSPVDGMGEKYRNDAVVEDLRNKNNSKINDIYENEDVVLSQSENLDNVLEHQRDPWNSPRPNISSPIQVTIPSGTPDIISNVQSLGYPSQVYPHAVPHSHSTADLRATSPHPAGPHPYHFPHPYPFTHHPSVHPYSHSMAHLNCSQCVSSSWSNLMSPHPSPFFHPVPWGSVHSTMARGHNVPGINGQLKHSHGDLMTYPDPNFQYPYPGGVFYPNGAPTIDPHFVKELHHQAEMQRLKKIPANSRHSHSTEEMESVTKHVLKSDTDETPNVLAAGCDENNDEPTELKEEMEPVIPKKQTEPWSCVHCTYVNPPGDYICQVCCKTSYRTTSSKSTAKQTEAQSMLCNRGSESPMELINMDALMPSPTVVESREIEKVI